MYTIEIYSRDNCSYCQMAKKVLKSRGITFKEYDVTHDSSLADEMRKRSSRMSVPQIFLNHEHIGGFDDMMKVISDGSFMQKLNIVTV